MLDISKQNEISDGFWLRKNATQNGIPADCVRAHTYLLNEGIGHFKEIIKVIIENGGGFVTMPMQPEYLEQYLTGFTFEYRAFCNLYEFNRQTEGYWRIDPNDQNNIIIFYNRCASSKRQRFSKVHELTHFLQTVDPPFMDFIDDLVENSSLPPDVIVRLLEKLTDKATAMYLMPNDFFCRKYQEIKEQSLVFGDLELRKLAKAFDVSPETTRYRLQECLGVSVPFQTSAGAMSP